MDQSLPAGTFQQAKNRAPPKISLSGSLRPLGYFGGMDDNVGLCHLLHSDILPLTGPAGIDLPPPDTKRWVARRKAQCDAQRRHHSRGSLPPL
jgi:hypothetical protein